MTPSEILGELRNDGWSCYHRLQFEAAIRELEVKVAALKIEIYRLKSPEIEEVGCA